MIIVDMEYFACCHARANALRCGNGQLSMVFEDLSVRKDQQVVLSMQAELKSVEQEHNIADTGAFQHYRS